MTLSSQPLPTLGQPNATEDPKVRSLLSEIQGIVNGNIDASNLASTVLAVTSARLTPTVQLSTTIVNASLSTSLADTVSLTFTPAVAGRSIFIAYVNARYSTTNNSTPGGINTQLFVDGVALSGTLAARTTLGPSSANIDAPLSVVGFWVPTLTAASHTVKTLTQTVTGTAGTVDSAGLLRIELGS